MKFYIKRYKNDFVKTDFDIFLFSIVYCYLYSIVSLSVNNCVYMQYKLILCITS